MDELPKDMPQDEHELLLKLQAVGQPYLDQMNADPLNTAKVLELQNEMNEKLQSIIWEYELRKYLPDCDHAAYQAKSGHK